MTIITCDIIQNWCVELSLNLVSAAIALTAARMQMSAWIKKKATRAIMREFVPAALFIYLISVVRYYPRIALGGME